MRLAAADVFKAQQTAKVGSLAGEVVLGIGSPASSANWVSKRDIRVLHHAPTVWGAAKTLQRCHALTTAVFVQGELSGNLSDKFGVRVDNAGVGHDEVSTARDRLADLLLTSSCVKQAVWL